MRLMVFSGVALAVAGGLVAANVNAYAGTTLFIAGLTMVYGALPS